MAVRAKALVSSHLIARIAGSNPAEGMDVRPLYLLCAVWVVASATGWSLVQRSSTGCVTLIVCDLATLILRRPRPDWGCCVTKN